MSKMTYGWLLAGAVMTVALVGTVRAEESAAEAGSTNAVVSGEAAASDAKADHKQRKQEMMLKRYDKDGDGELSKSEKKAARKDKKKMVEKYDADGDGELSDEERSQARKGMKEEFRGKHAEGDDSSEAGTDDDADGDDKP